MFQIKCTNASVSSELTALFFYEGEQFPKAYEKIDTDTGGMISKAFSDTHFESKYGKMKGLSYLYDGKLSYILMVGVGKESDLNKEKIEGLGGKIHAAAVHSKVKTLSVELGSIKDQILCASFYAGMKLQSYRFDKYRTNITDDAKSKLREVNLVVLDTASVERGIIEEDAVVSGVFLARDVTSEPPNVLYPESYANIITTELSALGVKVTTLGVAEMKKLGMGALLGVGQGSAYESKLVVMEYYAGVDKDTRPLAFVGKGVTFDTGGISIKPSNGMWDMKYDMAGSASVVGLMKALAARKAKVNVVGVVGLVENMPDGAAQRPSDVVKTMAGKTIEVLDTDAEGRLVLADALWYTQDKFKPEFIVDLATLTGAITVALGHTYAGCFSNNDTLSDRLIASGLKVGEKLWRMPMHKDYEEMMKSEIADMANISNVRGAAGSSSAAAFLKPFVNDCQWAHLDIAGMAWEKKGTSITPKGAVGYGVRLLNQLIKDHYEAN